MRPSIGLVLTRISYPKNWELSGLPDEGLRADGPTPAGPGRTSAPSGPPRRAGRGPFPPPSSPRRPAPAPTPIAGTPPTYPHETPIEPRPHSPRPSPPPVDPEAVIESIQKDEFRIPIGLESKGSPASRIRNLEGPLPSFRGLSRAVEESTPKNEFRRTNSELRRTNSEERIPRNELRIPKNEFRRTNSEE